MGVYRNIGNRNGGIHDVVEPNSWRVSSFLDNGLWITQIVDSETAGQNQRAFFPVLHRPRCGNSMFQKGSTTNLQSVASPRERILSL